MKKAWLALGLLAAAMGSASAATLTPQKGVSILFINGQESQTKIGKNEINDGYNQVVVRMEKAFGNSGVFTSEPYVLTFDVSGDDIEVKHPQARSKMEAEKTFRAGAPDWKVIQDDVKLKHEQDVISNKGGFLPFLGMDDQVAQYNEEKAIYFKDGVLADKPAEAIVIATTSTAVAATTTASNEVNVANVSEAAQTQAQPVQLPEVQTVEQLKAWYLKASKAERKEFRKWMIDQE